MTDKELDVLCIFKITKRYRNDRANKYGPEKDLYEQIDHWYKSKTNSDLAVKSLDLAIEFGMPGTNCDGFLREADESYRFVIDRSQPKAPAKAKRPPTKKKAAGKKPSQATFGVYRSATLDSEGPE